MKSKKKLLIFHPALAPYRVNFFNSLGKYFECKIVFLQQNNINQKFNQEELLRDAIFSYSYLKKHFLIFRRNFNFGYWNSIKEFNPDIIICNEFGLSLISVFSYKILHRAKFSIYTMCDDSKQIFESVSGIRKKLITFFAPKVKGIITVNPFVSELLCSHYKAKRTCFFPIIREENQYRNELIQALTYSNTYIEKYNLKGYKNFLFVGRLTPVKNLPALLKAYSQIPSALFKESKLILVGDGGEKEALRDLIEQLNMKDHVIWAGRYEGQELIAWYSVADFFVLPSIWEPFGAVTAEALQAGSKVLVSEQAGSSCLVTKDNGLIVDVSEEGKLRNSLSYMIEQATPLKEAVLRPNLLLYSYNSLIDDLISFLHET